METPNVQELIRAAQTDTDKLDTLAQVFADNVIESVKVLFIPSKMLPPAGLPSSIRRGFTVGVNMGSLWSAENVVSGPEILFEQLFQDAIGELLPKLEAWVWGELTKLGYVHRTPLIPSSDVLQNERAYLWVQRQELSDLLQWPEFERVGSVLSWGGTLGVVSFNDERVYTVLCDITRYDTMCPELGAGEWAYISARSPLYLSLVPSVRVDSGIAHISIAAEIQVAQ